LAAGSCNEGRGHCSGHRRTTAPSPCGGSIGDRVHSWTGSRGGSKRGKSTWRRSGQVGPRQASAVLVPERAIAGRLKPIVQADLRGMGTDTACGRPTCAICNGRSSSWPPAGYTSAGRNGAPSVHPMQGDEIRALRRLQREQGLSYRLRGLPHMAWAQAYPTRAEVSGLTGDLTRVLRRIYARCVV
jgi:hypothetical protein